MLRMDKIYAYYLLYILSLLKTKNIKSKNSPIPCGRVSHGYSIRYLSYEEGIKEYKTHNYSLLYWQLPL